MFVACTIVHVCDDVSLLILVLMPMYFHNILFSLYLLSRFTLNVFTSDIDYMCVLPNSPDSISHVAISQVAISQVAILHVAISHEATSHNV